MDPKQQLQAAPPRGRDAVVGALIESATRLFAELGTEGASVREIAAGAGVNHALVFRHFGSKERLVRVVLDQLLDDLVEEFRGAGMDPDALAAIGESVAERDSLWRLLTRAVLDGEIDFLTERPFPEIDAVLATLERGAAAGALPTAVDPRTLLLIVLSGALGWGLLEGLMVRSVGMPGETPRRRRELARAAFAELLGALPPGATKLSPEESEKAEIPREAPLGVPSSGTSRETRHDPALGPPRGRAQVCDALIRSAMELMALRGAAAVSVRQIAHRAGVNHALVFRHFGSKDGLVRAVWERVIEDLAGRVMEVPDYQGFTMLTDALAESETLWRLLARAILDGETEMIAATQYPFLNQMVWAVKRGQSAGMVETTLNPRLIVSMVCAMGFGWLVFNPVLVPLLGIPPREPQEHIAELRLAVAELLGVKDTPSLRGSH